MDYVGLEVSSDGVPAVAAAAPEAEPTVARQVCRTVGSNLGKACRYVLNAVALSAGAVIGAYCSFYTLSQIAPLNIHVTVTASLPGPV